MKSGDYFEALESLHRVYFFDSESEYRADVAKNIAECYVELIEYNKASKFYDIAYNSEDNDSIKNELSFRKVLIFFLQSQHQYALAELYALDENLIYKHKKANDFYSGITQFQLGKYEESKADLEKCFISMDSKEKLDSLFNIVENINDNWPRISQFMSVFIPGSGQLANGAYKSAINSFVLTGSLLFLYGFTISQYSFVDAVISVMPWYMRYNRGGYENAYKIALQKQDEKRNDILFKIIELYEENL